jgi:uncharacterized protein (DUF362 family)
MENSYDTKLTRRTFIKGAAATVAMAGVLSPYSWIRPSKAFGATEPDILIAEKGGPTQLLKAAMEPMGGMGRFVKKGQRVVIKANIAWARTPEQACTNNPELLFALIKMCYGAGAKKVAVWDHTCDNYQFCFSRSGLKKVTQDAGAEIFSGHGRNVYKAVEIPRGKKLKKAEVIKDVIEADVLINFPIPKQHFATELTLGLKNMMGVLWDMELLHKIDLHQSIADINTLRKADLVVVDAIRILTTNGPKGPGQTEDPKQVIVSTDVVAVDGYTASLFKNPKTGSPFKPLEIPFIKHAYDLKLGEINLSKVKITKAQGA